MQNYFISLKNRLLLFKRPAAVKEILADVKADAGTDSEALMIYGESGRFAKELKENGEAVSYVYIAEIVFLLALLAFSPVLLNGLPLWIYTLVRAAEYSVFGIEMFKDYLLPTQLEVNKQVKKEFIIGETFLSVIGLAFMIYAWILPAYMEAHTDDLLQIGSLLRTLVWIIIGLYSLVFIYSVIRYFASQKICFGGIFIQALIMIDTAAVYYFRLGAIENLSDYENCGISPLIGIIIAWGYAFWRKKNKL
ncbi:MAG: hypothetical protein MJ131_01045 [Lachnospiraceae bacterium]|nr:hypothetical protein [Lachnospiraceae bacterium]